MFKQKRVILILVLLIGCMSSISLFSVLHYFDPFRNMKLAFYLLATSFIFTVCAFTTLLLYAIKKVYFRGEVGVHHILVSLRQSFFISIFFLLYFILSYFAIPVLFPMIFMAIILVLVELLIKNITS